MALNYTVTNDGVVIAMFGANGMPKFETLTKTHPEYNRIVRALRKKQWSKVPKMLDIASVIANKSCGQVEVTKDGIFYKGTKVDNSLTDRILELIRHGKPVSHMLRFMDNLFQNPEAFAIHELYDWLKGCKLPITDRGTFMAYKRVRSDYKDCYTGLIDNSVGQIVYMERKDVNPNRKQTCSRGLHFCSVAYLPNYPGDRIMQVEINPKDVVSIPDDYNYTKGRTWLYEVIAEIPAEALPRLLDMGIDIDEYQVPVYSIASDRKKLIADIMSLPTVKSMVRKQRKMKKVKRGRKSKDAKFLISERSIRKMTIGRLRKLYMQFAPPEPPKVSPLTDNRLADIRKAYGLSRGEVAEALGISYREAANIEFQQRVGQDQIDAYLGAIMNLAKLGPSYRSGVSFPKPTMQAPPMAAAAAVGSNDHFGDETEEDWGDEFDEFDDED